MSVARTPQREVSFDDLIAEEESFDDLVAEEEPAPEAAPPPPAPAPPTRRKAPPTPPTPAQRARWEVETGRDSQGREVSPAFDVLASAASRATPASALWDRFAPDGSRVGDAAARGDERIQRVWDDYTQGDARLGGRNRIRPIVGEDRRSEALIAGIGQGASLGLADEAAGAIRSGSVSGEEYEAARDEARGRTERVQEQAPELFGGGEMIGTLPWMAINPSSAGGRVALGAGIGGISAGGHSEHDLGTVELADDVLLGAGLGAGASALAEVPGLASGAIGQRGRDAARRLVPRFREGARRAQEGADDALLEATGFWGRRAAERIDEAGGPAAMAADMRRFGIGRGAGQRIPRSEQSARDLQALGRGGGQTMELIAETADEAGAAVPTRRVIDAAESEARRLEQLGTQTALRAAERIRAEVAPLAGRPDMPVSRAWALRRHFDSMADFSSGQGADDVARTAGEQFRSLRQHLDREMDSALQSVGLGRQWDEASRMSQLGILSREVGAGHRRLSSAGGIQGATAGGDLVAEAVRTGNPLRVAASIPQTIIARAAGQEARMVAPGAIARMREGSAAGQRAIADRLYRLAQSRPGALGQYTQSVLAAGARGASALATEVYVRAQRDPAFRALLERVQGGEEEEGATIDE